MSNIYNNSKLIIHTDGGSRGNPGPAAIGVVIYDDNKTILHQFARSLGIATNNQAEYQAVVDALSYLLINREQFPLLQSVTFYLDSELVVKQLNGLYRIKQSDLIELSNQVKQSILDIKVKVDFIHVRREFNQVADHILNQELDSRA